MVVIYVHFCYSRIEEGCVAKSIGKCAVKDIEKEAVKSLQGATANTLIMIIMGASLKPEML